MVKKSLAPVIEIALLLLVVVSAAIYFQYWYNSYNSAKLTKAEMTGFKDNLKFLGSVKISSTAETLFFRTKKGYEIIDEIKVGGNTCLLPGNNVITTVSTPVIIWCPGGIKSSEAVVITNADLYEEDIELH